MSSSQPNPCPHPHPHLFRVSLSFKPRLECHLLLEAFPGSQPEEVLEPLMHLSHLSLSLLLDGELILSFIKCSLSASHRHALQ